MRQKTPTLQPIWHRLALLLACVVLWLDTGAALHHTDDLSGLRSFVACSDSIHALSPAPPAVPCAACEWAQTLPLVPVSDVPVFAPAFTRTEYVAALTPSPYLRLRLSASPRAPPVCS